MFDFTDGQNLLADAIHQHHHAKITAEPGGVHDDVGFFRQRVVFPDLHLAQMAVDSLTVTTVLRGELGGSLLARAVVRPKRSYIEPFSAVKTFAAFKAYSVFEPPFCPIYTPRISLLRLSS